MERWRVAPPLLEDLYTFEDALVVGCMLITLLRHADRVKIACQAQLVNVIGLVRTEEGGPAWRQTIFHPFAQTARLARGTSLRVEPSGASHETALHGLVDTVDASATWDQATGAVAVFLVNRHPTQSVQVTVDVRGFGGLQVSECLRLDDADPRRTNTSAEPHAVQPRPVTGIHVEGGCLELRLTPASWTAVALAPHL
jgi:alpha-N-arabinofuranosidase